MEKNFANTHNKINKKDHPNLLNSFYYSAKIYAYMYCTSRCLIFVNSRQKTIILERLSLCRSISAKGVQRQRV